MHASKAHADDSCALKNSIQDYIYCGHTLEPKFGDEHKADHGFNHEVIARLLCPAEKVVDFDLDSDRGVIFWGLMYLITYSFLYTAS